MRRRDAHSTVTRRWSIVRFGVACSNGGHLIERDEQALFSRASWQTSVLCVTCAKTLYGLEPPAPAWSCNVPAPEDVKVRQSGGDE